MRSTIRDILFISFIFLVSSLPYVTAIGFYMDDWIMLSPLYLSSDQSFIGLFNEATNPATFPRPVQNALVAALFSQFGLDPIGYQLSNIGILLATIVLFYLLLKKLRVNRLLCISIPLLYILLPNFSTDRFWFAAFQINVSSLFYFMSSYATLKVLETKKQQAFIWGIISIGTLLLSVFAYEVTLPFFIFNIFILWYLKVKKSPTYESRFKEYVLTASTFFAVLASALFKAKVTTRLDDGPLKNLLIYPLYLGYVVLFAVWTNYIQLFVSFIELWRNFRLDEVTSIAFLCSLIIGISIGSFLYYNFRQTAKKITTDSWKKTIISGMVIFFLGFSIFFLNSNFSFSLTGMDNRVTIMAAIGVAISLIGIIGWLSQFISPKRGGMIFFPIGMGLICMSGSLEIYKIAESWGKAYSQQKVILAEIKQSFPELHSNSTFILDGICPYIGPAPVFVANWDLKGALQILYEDETLRADVVTPKMWLTQEGIKTRYYTDIRTYPYYKVTIYNYKSNETILINSKSDAIKYFEKKDFDFSNNCPIDQSDPKNVTSLKPVVLGVLKLLINETRLRAADYFSRL